MAFLHCVSDYPVKDNEANLLSVSYLKDKLPITVGLSDHVLGIESSLVAVSLGAKIIEKHFTLNNNFSNFRDHQISLDPKNMSKMVTSINRVEKMLGNYSKNISKNEKKNLNSMRRSIYFNLSLKKGSKIKREHLKIVRPFKKLNPNDISKVLGKKLKKMLKTLI